MVVRNTCCGLSLVVIALLATASGQQKQRPYRLESVDLKQPVIWGAELRQPEGKGLAFGGQDQDADDGRPHTRVLVDGNWQRIDEKLRAGNPLQSFYALAWKLRHEAKHAGARARAIYFKGLPSDEETQRIAKEVAPRLDSLTSGLKTLDTKLAEATVGGDYEQGQIRFARAHLDAAAKLLPDEVKRITPQAIQQLHRAQIHLELAAEATGAEPPPRAMDCGQPRGEGDAASHTLVWLPKQKLYLLFGGDHLDYLTCDTWVFDPAGSRWYQRHPQGAPPPRANHELKVLDDGTIRLTGGYTYASNTDYVGGQYLDLDDGAWIYDVDRDAWQPADDNKNELVAADIRTYRTGPLHPDHYLQGDRPDAAKFESWLKNLPVNTWVATDPPYRPRLNRDWGVARIDPGRDLMLRWSGGHSAHGGTDVPHYHFSTNRWELCFPVEFPLGQLYSNTSYPNGYNFNLRPWMTGHTYQNYDYDPPSGMMVKAGRPRHFYVYDPDLGDWVGRGLKPKAMQYNSCFYTLTLAATPGGAMCWDRNGRVHRYDHEQGEWIELKLSGGKLPGAYVDNSSIVYDSKRDRLLILNTQGYGKPYDGQVWSVDLKTGAVKGLDPEGREGARRLATVDRSCYDAQSDLLLVGTYLKDAGDHTLTPAYDCAANRWTTLDVAYDVSKRGDRTVRAFPHQRSDALMFDPARKLIWGTDTGGQVFVLRLDMRRANQQPLE